jgi:hypothetical protein
MKTTKPIVTNEETKTVRTAKATTAKMTNAKIMQNAKTAKTEDHKGCEDPENREGEERNDRA